MTTSEEGFRRQKLEKSEENGRQPKPAVERDRDDADPAHRTHKARRSLALPDEVIDRICERLRRGLPTRREIGADGRLNLDRPLPFLCVYRAPNDFPDAGTAQLVNGEAAHLIAPSTGISNRKLSRLVRKLADTGTGVLGGFLTFELWSVPDEFIPHKVDPESGEPMLPGPAFRILYRGPGDMQATIDSLARSLQRLKINRQTANVRVDSRGKPYPPGRSDLLLNAEMEPDTTYSIGLEVLPIYRHPKTGVVLPKVLRQLRRGLSSALKEAFFTFSHDHTNARPQHYQALGQRTLVKMVWEVDRQLAQLSESFDFLLQVTPVNAESAWREFNRSRFSKTPTFHYRPLTLDPVLLKRKLFQIPLERIEDPTVAYLFRQKQDELDRKITMLSDIGTERFLHGSLQAFGGIEPSLLEIATQLLNRLSPKSREDSHGRPLTAVAFAERAEQEIAYYRARYPKFTAKVKVSDELYSGLLVSGETLLIGRETQIPAGRVEALLQHEVGTHLVTYFNGRAQPLQQLRTGLPGYDGLQEGLAVLAEYLVGGLSKPRLRLLAARVLAVHNLIQGASFVETFRILSQQYGMGQRTAYTVTMRVYRGGGLTKDAVYLRGLVEILDYLRMGGELGPLMIGKIARDHVPMVKELRLREVLPAPPLTPRYMFDPGVAQKLDRLRRMKSVIELVARQRKT